ncbi:MULTISPECIES: photosystem II manganese-stabilizing polypeptide [Prochlorococcus]|uniref:photosystem II manganese-stabilizing polypeptide n=1 Tax=Prochlorococcus TaxID=1218 RepID=UPI000533994E|nr:MULTISPECIES: photosystem II manganese-stabilizing polypeptide [Prochlorococcus]KGG13138.1 Photosystem II manganese-stabilizing protein (PsbO) [Prochlorococcus sp. MIT 0601]
MRFRPLLALVLAFCLTFISAPSSASASGERGNSKFADIVNTGKANDCPSLPAESGGSLSIDGGLTDICMHPTQVYVKVAKTKRSKADFAPAKIISPRNNTTVEQVYGDVSGSTFKEKGGIDFQLITVLAPNGEEYPFVFSAKDMSVEFKSKSIQSGTEANGTTFTPSYRTGDFLDPKSRAKDTGVEYAQGLVALGGDDEELAKENIKRDISGQGVITLSIDTVDSDTEEFAGTFVAIQPSDNDLGSKEPVDVKIIGELYGRKA